MPYLFTLTIAIKNSSVTDMGNLAMDEPSAFQQLKALTFIMKPPSLPPPPQLMPQEYPGKRNLSAHISRNMVLPEINTAYETGNSRGLIPSLSQISSQVMARHLNTTVPKS